MTYSLTLTDNLTIIESPARSGDNISLIFGDSLALVESAPDVYKIVRAADTAFARTDYP